MSRLLRGDAVERLRELDDESVAMVLFSPPYGDIRTYEGEWSIDIPALAKELHRVTAIGGFCCIVIGDTTKNFRKSLASFRTAIAFEDAGWSCFEVCIYARDGRPGGWWAKRFRVDHEYIVMMFKGDRPRPLHQEHLRIPTKHPGFRWAGTARATDGSLKEIPRIKEGNKEDKCKGTIWPYTASAFEGNRTKMEHPATYPDKLAEDLIRMATDRGEVVLDPMCGSGTTCVVARQQGRRFVGIDVSATYLAIARRRLDDET
jgi:DNA modification methylase